MLEILVKVCWIIQNGWVKVQQSIVKESNTLERSAFDEIGDATPLFGR